MPLLLRTDFSVLQRPPWHAPKWPPPSVHVSSFTAKVVQIVGHSAARCNMERDAHCTPIQVSDGLVAIDVDAAMLNQGGRAFLTLHESRFLAHAKTSSQPTHWTEMDLSALMCKQGAQGFAKQHTGSEKEPVALHVSRVEKHRRKNRLPKAQTKPVAKRPAPVLPAENPQHLSEDELSML